MVRCVYNIFSKKKEKVFCQEKVNIQTGMLSKHWRPMISNNNTTLITFMSWVITACQVHRI